MLGKEHGKWFKSDSFCNTARNRKVDLCTFLCSSFQLASITPEVTAQIAKQSSGHGISAQGVIRAVFFGGSDFVRFLAKDFLEIDRLIVIAEEVIQGGLILIFADPQICLVRRLHGSFC